MFLSLHLFPHPKDEFSQSVNVKLKVFSHWGDNMVAHLYTQPSRLVFCSAFSHWDKYHQWNPGSQSLPALVMCTLRYFLTKGLRCRFSLFLLEKTHSILPFVSLIKRKLILGPTCHSRSVYVCKRRKRDLFDRGV